MRSWPCLLIAASWFSLGEAQLPPLAIENIVDIGPFVDTQSCYSALNEADADMDGFIDREEYVTFVDLLAGDEFSFPADTTFADLPLILQLNFNTLACLCRNVPDAADDCCIGDNAAISTGGAGPGETPTNPQQAYLFTVCLFTETTIDRVLESGAPSEAPTEMPSASPSSAPSEITIVPTAVPTTGVPTSTPSPTAGPSDAVVMAFYEIAVADGNVDPGVEPSTYEDDLVAAMDIVATNVANEEIFQRLRVRRRLTVTVQNTTVDGTFVSVCPNGFSSTFECRDVQSSVVILLEDEDDPEATATAYELALNRSIQAGDLEEALQEVNPNSPVTILTGRSFPPPTPAPTGDGGGGGSDNGLSGGGIAGIVIFASVATIGAVGFLVYRKRRQTKENPYFPSGDEGQASRDMGRDATTMGAVAPDFSKDLEAQQKADDSSSNAGSSGWSSSAGVSSLNTADSIDKNGAAAALAAAGVVGGAAALGAGAKNRSGIEAGDVPELPNVTRDDLDTAIESGDWAAVGATAALLAAASDSQSASSRSRKSTQSKGSTVSSIDAARAAELDHLVDSGDWEGVVLAAARFEKSEGDSSSSKTGSGSKGTGSQSRSGTGSFTAGSATGSVGTSSAYSQGGSTSLSESPSKAAKRAEIRKEVEALVSRVVPDEIDNVDEMMLQFKGREEELVETLRTMQERSIAQRARAAERKSAKIQARDDVRRSRDAAAVGAGAAKDGADGLSAGAVAGIAAGAAVAGAGVAAAVGAASRDSKDKDEKGPMHEEVSAAAVPSLADEASGAPSGLTTEPSSGLSSEDDKKRRRTALELAIEAGDWEAVGEAAAMMSDASATTGSMSHTDIDIDTTGTGSTGSSKRRRTGVNAERAAELDRMIDKGDWSGVVNAASAFSKNDKTKSDKSSGTGSGSATTGSGSGSGSGSQRRSWFGRKKSGEGDESVDDSSKAKAIKEEQDALAQAEVWMAIAEQSKTEGTTEAEGASDAADWAIARSLSALRHAEAGGELKSDSTRTKGATASSASVDEASTGDKSV